jgi:tetratricopeptide (TPR) repeat protein
MAQGVAAWESDDFQSAYEQFRCILDEHPEFADVRNKAGLCLAMMGEMDRALAEFDGALELNTSYAEAHLNRAIVLNDLGRFEEASEAFRCANKLDTQDSMVFPSDLGNQLADSHARSGDLYLVANRPEQAAQEYAAAVSVRPRFADLRFRLAEAYLDLNRLDDARGHLEAILEVNPGFLDARVRLGALLHRIGDLGGARREWEQCAEADPDDRRVQAYLAALDT